MKTRFGRALAGSKDAAPVESGQENAPSGDQTKSLPSTTKIVFSSIFRKGQFHLFVGFIFVAYLESSVKLCFADIDISFAFLTCSHINEW